MITKLWSKILVDNRVKKNFVLNVQDFDIDNIHVYLQDICYHYDIETPIVLTKHLISLNDFNIVKFNSADFVDSIDFDYLLIERTDYDN